MHTLYWRDLESPPMANGWASRSRWRAPIGRPLSFICNPAARPAFGPGQYRFGDFVRIGVPFTLLVMFVCVLVIPWLFPL